MIIQTTIQGVPFQNSSPKVSALEYVSQINLEVGRFCSQLLIVNLRMPVFTLNRLATLSKRRSSGTSFQLFYFINISVGKNLNTVSTVKYYKEERGSLKVGLLWSCRLGVLGKTAGSSQFHNLDAFWHKGTIISGTIISGTLSFFFFETR